MSSFHMCGKVWSAPGNFSSAQSEGGGGCWAKLSPAPVRAGEWLKLMLLGPGPAENGLLCVCLSKQSPPKIAGGVLVTPSTDGTTLSPLLQCDGEVGEVQNLRPTKVLRWLTQAGEKHPNICPWVKDPEKKKKNNSTWISSSQALMFSSSATDTWVSQ